MSDIYTGTMGMITNMNKIDVISNNLANAKTNGYKTDRTSNRVFDETFKRMNQGGEISIIGGYKDQIYMDNIESDFRPGSVKLTNNRLDIYLEDRQNENQTSFLVVERNGEELLTRNGQLTLDGQGYLTTINGAFVLDEDGSKIQLDKDTDFYMETDGRVRLAETNEELAALQLRTVNQEHLGYLEKTYATFFRVTDFDSLVENYGGVENILNRFDEDVTLQKIFKDREKLEEIVNTGEVNILEEFSGTVQSNTLEMSNVDMSYELTKLLESQKGVQFSQKVINAFDKINEKAANDIAR